MLRQRFMAARITNALEVLSDTNPVHPSVHFQHNRLASRYFGYLQVADESGSPVSNRSAFSGTESPMSTPSYLESGHGMSVVESSITDRPAKRPRYESSLYSSRMLPPLVCNSDPTTELRSAVTAGPPQVEPALLRVSDAPKIKPLSSRKYSRRLSVSSLLSGPPDAEPSEQHINGREWDYQSQDWTPYMHDVYQDTETWGIDEGLWIWILTGMMTPMQYQNLLLRYWVFTRI
ncbi:hypothetical protein DID88_004096 [Monilinia fructigena]|uniref:Uncharacterized protein n=1 Tax=Monilinia fructigena TaxID=38457 RepID=A0A395IRS5_9HELO|nr:hypothetical protein DID88_004096 [Monilinia fructigena]